MYDRLISKVSRIAVVALGNAGLPLAKTLAEHFSVKGFDIDEKRISDIKASFSTEGHDIRFTSNPADLREADFFIVTVPVYLDEHRNPDMKSLVAAAELVGSSMKKGSYVVFESTVYPGCTADVLVPVLVRASGLEYISDFKVGYSPSRIDISNPDFSLSRNVKVVSACDSEAMEEIASVYSHITEAGIHKAPTMRIAEAAKVLESTQLDVNVAFMNEFSAICNRVGMNTQDIITAAATNRQFYLCEPGLVNGLSVSQDPYQLMYKAASVGYHSRMVPAARAVNDRMGEYVANQTVKKLLAHDMPLLRAKALVMGIGTKANCGDFRNSMVVEIVKELKSFRLAVDVVDPYVDPDYLEEQTGIELVKVAPTQKYHVIIVAVPHRDYMKLDEQDFLDKLEPNGLIVDINGVFRNQIHSARYWSL